MSNDLTFTGERLHADDALFGIDLLRHRAAYRAAIEIAKTCEARRILEMGSGTGYGTLELAEALPFVTAIDRAPPLKVARAGRAHFVRADLTAMPLLAQSTRGFDLVVSFQVIEHLPDPTRYLMAIQHALRPGGIALISTPNRATSEGENPFHVREYLADELQSLLETHFSSVEMQGISARGEAWRYHEARLASIRKILHIDPLGLRHRLPRRWRETLFAFFARRVRRGIASGAGGPNVRLEDFPFEAVHPDSLDLVAICHP